MLKKALSVLIVLVMVFALVGCGGQDAPEEEGGEQPGEALPGEGKIVTMITDTGGLGDKSFNDLAWKGLEDAQAEYGFELKILQSATEDDYALNIQSALDENPDLIVCVGFMMQEATRAAAQENPDVNFALVDGTGDLDDDGVNDIPNLLGLKFKENEGSFLVGVVAGMTTETDKIGYIGGMEFPSIIVFESGFLAGVKSVNPDAEVFVEYADSFGDMAKGKEIATAQHKQGADIIYHAAGGVGLGLFQAATENDFWAIGVDADQALTSPENAANILCSMLKRVDTATYEAAKRVMDGAFVGEILTFGLADDGIGVGNGGTIENEDGEEVVVGENLTDDMKAAIEEWKAAIIEGKFAPPMDRDAVAAFEVPEI